MKTFFKFIGVFFLALILFLGVRRMRKRIAADDTA